MKKRILAIMFGLCSVGLNAENQAIDPFSINPFVVPEEFKTQLEDYRTGWKRVTGYEYSGLHWNQFIAVYLSDGLETYRNNYSEYLRYHQDYEDDEDEVEEPNFMSYPTGTIVLKENFAATEGLPKIPLTITMMLKREDGYDPQGGEWEYVQFDANGNMILRGNSQSEVVNKACANCHMNLEERDYIFSNFFSKSK